MSDGLRIEVTMPAPVEDVWTAFRDPDDPPVARLGGRDLDDEIRTIFVDGTVVEADGRSLHVGGTASRSSRRPPDDRARPRAAPLHREELDWDAYYDDVDEGWLSFLQQLRFALPHHWGDHAAHHPPRRHATAPTTAPAALGLDVGGPAGARYAAEVAGEQLTGDGVVPLAAPARPHRRPWGPGLLWWPTRRTAAAWRRRRR